jgi:hypothetical protein
MSSNHTPRGAGDASIARRASALDNLADSLEKQRAGTSNAPILDHSAPAADETLLRATLDAARKYGTARLKPATAATQPAAKVAKIDRTPMTEAQRTALNAELAALGLPPIVAKTSVSAPAASETRTPAQCIELAKTFDQLAKEPGPKRARWQALARHWRVEAAK